MREFLDRKMIGMKLRAMNCLNRFLKEEDGDTNFVSIIIIIVIVLAVATVFRKQLTQAIELVMGKFTSFINETN